MVIRTFEHITCTDTDVGGHYCRLEMPSCSSRTFSRKARCASSTIGFFPSNACSLAHISTVSFGFHSLTGAFAESFRAGTPSSFPVPSLSPGFLVDWSTTQHIDVLRLLHDVLYLCKFSAVGAHCLQNKKSSTQARAFALPVFRPRTFSIRKAPSQHFPSRLFYLLLFQHQPRPSTFPLILHIIGRVGQPLLFIQVSSLRLIIDPSIYLFARHYRLAFSSSSSNILSTTRASPTRVSSSQNVHLAEPHPVPLLLHSPICNPRSSCTWQICPIPPLEKPGFLRSTYNHDQHHPHPLSLSKSSKYTSLIPLSGRPHLKPEHLQRFLVSLRTFQSHHKSPTRSNLFIRHILWSPRHVKLLSSSPLRTLLSAANTWNRDRFAVSCSSHRFPRSAGACHQAFLPRSSGNRQLPSLNNSSEPFLPPLTLVAACLLVFAYLPPLTLEHTPHSTLVRSHPHLIFSQSRSLASFLSWSSANTDGNQGLVI